MPEQNGDSPGNGLPQGLSAMNVVQLRTLAIYRPECCRDDEGLLEIQNDGTGAMFVRWHHSTYGQWWANWIILAESKMILAESDLILRT